jgi:hypothetical protein
MGGFEDHQAGWPDAFVKKSAKIDPNPFFVNINALLEPWKGEAHKFALVLFFFYFFFYF